MKNLKLKLSFIAILISFVGMSQQSFDATVVGIINVGQQDYSVLNKNGTTKFYKTTLYSSGELYYNQSVVLSVNNETFLVTANTLTSNTYASIINTSNSSTNASLSSITLPTIENGILFFEDSQHYDDTYDLLESYINGGAIDQMLDNLENSIIGYTSYRTWFNNTYNWLEGEFSSEEIEYLSKLEFVNDEITKTLLNKDRFIGMGDTIYQYQAQNVFIKFSKYNTEAKSYLASLPFGTDISTKKLGIGDSLAFKIESLTFTYPDGSTIKSTNVVVEDSLRYVSRVYTNNVNCSVEQKMIKINVEEDLYADTTYNYDSTSYTIDWLTNDYWYLSNSNSNATLTIDWGDNTTQTINNYTGQWITHSYPSGSVGVYYHPETTLTFDDAKGDSQQLEDGTNVSGGEAISFFVNYACANAEIELWDEQDNGNWKMTTKVWVYKGILGSSKIGSYTHAWKASGNGWSRHKADIWCKVNGTFRDDNCISQSTKTGSKYRHLFKKVQKTKSKLFKWYDISNGDINSSHFMIKGNLTLQLSSVINPC